MTQSRSRITPPADAGFVPDAAALTELDEWFRRYDALAEAGDVAGTADLAMFPLNTVTDDAAGEGSAQQLDRAAYLEMMGGVLGGGGGGDLRMESRRTPYFLTPSLVVVFTEAEFTVDGERQQVRYADLLVKSGGQWRFQTMVQGGWGGQPG
ncbi:nuclear transport factor 2 family protein [Micromonospora sp. KC606]|uniref:nuclear transport factor 2 family protein n=1 Tax=Micromonospora sp. KC606 TaxID=2530379 RepID=UPI001051615A|nr:nuclear transport factor 2 family protein [Micromonospora sp. KC606]TDC78820.1 nuclear transport factor 2 family protein [Micromonospora sp. KC606]